MLSKIQERISTKLSIHFRTAQNRTWFAVWSEKKFNAKTPSTNMKFATQVNGIQGLIVLCKCMISEEECSQKSNTLQHSEVFCSNIQGWMFSSASMHCGTVQWYPRRNGPNFGKVLRLQWRGRPANYQPLKPERPKVILL